MTRRRLTVSVAAAVLVLGACTQPSTREASEPQPSTSVGSTTQGQPSSDGSSAEPSDDPLGDYDSTPEEAQRLLDDAVDALTQAPSVDVDAQRSWRNLKGRIAPMRLTGVWWPQERSWRGVATMRYDARHTYSTEVLVVDEHVYVRQGITKSFTGHWLDVTKSPDQSNWHLNEILESIEATRATTSGDTTTIVGHISTAVALDAFALDDSELLASVRRELGKGTTLVTMQVVDGFPTEISFFGRDVSLPDDGIPQLSLDVLSPLFVDIRLAPGDEEPAPQKPPPGQVDTLREVVQN